MPQHNDSSESDKLGDFVPGRKADSDELKDHIRPSSVDETVNVPEGEWVDVPKGMVAAPGTYVDSFGVLRSSGDGSCVVWHNRGCQKRGIQPHEIIYGENKAPWCPKCWEENEPKRQKKAQESKVKKLFDLFRGKTNTN